MRAASRQQHPLHLQVTHTNNGKYLVTPTYHHQPQLQSQPQNQQQPTSPNNDEIASSPGSPTTVGPVQPQSPASPTAEGPAQNCSRPVILAERFLLTGPAEGSTLYRCLDVKTGQQLIAKAITLGDRGCEALVQAHMRLERTGAASDVRGVVDPGSHYHQEPEDRQSRQQQQQQLELGSASVLHKRYLLLEGHYGDLHAYVRARRRLREEEARRLFKQAARAVATCHEHSVVLRDLKLRKFVFANETRTKLRLESLEDAVLVEPENDCLTDRRGCPAYVAPEVLRSGRAYSGKAADVWSLGVLLYTMLVGRYPFNDAEHASLFAKISRGQFACPESLSPRARCLVRALLRREPTERPLAEDVLRHPWLARPALRQHGPGQPQAQHHQHPQATSLGQPAQQSHQQQQQHHHGLHCAGAHLGQQPRLWGDQLVPEPEAHGALRPHQQQPCQD